jgi:hypothetical protein
MASTYPTWLPGQRITAALLAAGQTILVLKSANQDVTNTTTLQNDTELTYPLAANGIYRVRIVIFALSASATPDLKTAWAVPTGTSGLKMCQGPTDTAASFTSRTNTAARMSGHAFTTTVVYQVDTAAVAIEEEGIVTVGSTAGNVTLQWTQNTANATATSVLASSFLTVERLG